MAVKVLSKFLKSKKASCVGLDVGSYSVKAVVLSPAGKKVTITGFALEQITRGEGGAAAFDPSPALNKVVTKLELSGENLATAISGQQVFMRYIEVAKMAKDELRASIKYETDVHFPFPLEDAIVDFHIPEAAGGVQDARMKVFVFAARKEMIESYLIMLKAANIVPGRISVDAVAIANACEGTIDMAGKCVSLVNIGARKTTIAVINNGIFSFAREAAIGCKKLSSAISKGVSVSSDEADRIVLKKIKDFDSYLSSFVTEVAREVKKSIDYFEERSSTKVETVHMSGGGSMIDGLDKLLSDDLGMGVNRVVLTGEATEGLEPDKRKEFESLSPLFTVAYGLGLGLSMAP